jgi:hypothetical protein
MVVAAMGKEVSEEEKNKVSWDSNAITPGTPFMDLLASSLRYWVVQKMNTDPGWKNVSLHSLLFAFRIQPYTLSCKFLSLTRGCLEKESIKLWTLLDANEVIRDIILILDM